MSLATGWKENIPEGEADRFERPAEGLTVIAKRRAREHAYRWSTVARGGSELSVEAS